MNTIEYVTFEETLQALPDTEFKNLTRSTIPLLNYWKNRTAPKISDLVRGLGFKRVKDCRLYFEYAVPSLTPREHPSCTDLMLVSDQLTIAIEAKWTEPKYETVNDWLQKGNRPHREKVLRHWLGLIQPFARNELKPEDFGDVVYQSIHRTASACAIPADKHAVLYQKFSLNDEQDDKTEHYHWPLHLLNDLIHPTDNLVIGLEYIRLTPNRNHSALLKRMESAKPQELANMIRDALATHNLFTFQTQLFQTYYN